MPYLEPIKVLSARSGSVETREILRTREEIKQYVARLLKACEVEIVRAPWEILLGTPPTARKGILACDVGYRVIYAADEDVVVDSPLSFAVCLHELGHINLKHTIFQTYPTSLLIQTEIEAWLWAMQIAEFTRPMKRLAHTAISSYCNDYHVPMNAPERWVFAR
jgi:hypothetical protein